eukprot:8152909-Pyramimonas_sp.AAC.1
MQIAVQCVRRLRPGTESRARVGRTFPVVTVRNTCLAQAFVHAQFVAMPRKRATDAEDCTTPPRQRLRLTDLGREARVTASGLSHILAEIRDAELPTAFSTFSIRKARQDIAFQSTDFGPILQKIPAFDCDGNDLEIWVQNPWAFLQAAARESEPFRQVLIDTLGKTNNYIRLIVYSDEITP